MKLTLSVKKICLVLLAIIGTLLALHFVLQYIALVVGFNPVETIPHRFNVDEEISIPTWFSQSLLLFAVALLALIAAFGFKNKDRYRYHWALLSAIFLYISIDEGAMLHEATILQARSLFSISDADPGWFSNAWVLLALPVVIVLAVVLWRFLFSLPARTRLFFFVAVGLYVGGVFGVEILGSRQVGFAYSVAVMIEEGLEMFGTLVFVYALLKYIKQIIPKLQIVLR